MGEAPTYKPRAILTVFRESAVVSDAVQMPGGNPDGNASWDTLPAVRLGHRPFFLGEATWPLPPEPMPLDLIPAGYLDLA